MTYRAVAPIATCGGCRPARFRCYSSRFIAMGKPAKSIPALYGVIVARPHPRSAAAPGAADGRLKIPLRADRAAPDPALYPGPWGLGAERRSRCRGNEHHGAEVERTGPARRGARDRAQVRPFGRRGHPGRGGGRRERRGGNAAGGRFRGGSSRPPRAARRRQRVGARAADLRRHSRADGERDRRAHRRHFRAAARGG